MSGSADMPSPPEPIAFGKLYLILWVFSAGAVAINLFMLGLMVQAIGWPALSPVQALIWAVPLSFPVNWLVTRWVRRLMDEADGR